MANTTNLTIYRKKTRQEENILLDTSGIDTGIPFIDTVDDSLDSLVISLRNYPKRKPFEPFDLITYTIEDENGTDTTQMFVLFDHVSYYSGFNGKATYTHKISCVETTKYLEKIKIFNLNLTNKNDTLYDQFVKALANAEPKITPSTYPRGNRFSMSQHLIDFLQGKASRDFHLGNTDLRSALDEMLQAENARIYVEEIIPTNYAYSVVLGYQSYNIIQDVTPIWEKDKHGVIVSEEIENDGQNYAGKIVARGQNTVLEEPITFRDSFKAGSATINDKTSVVLFPFPISHKGIKKFVVKNLPIIYRKSSINDSITRIVNADIAKYIIPQEEYELFSESKQQDYIPYSINGTEISFDKTYSKWYGLKIKSILKAILNSVPKIAGYADYEPGEVVNSDLKWWNYPIECTYYPIINTIVEMGKSDTYNLDKNLLGITDSQTEKTLNADLHGKKLAGLINRTGNATYTVGVKADKFFSLLPVMSRITLPDAEDEEDTNYVMYKREYAVYDNYVDCKYYFSKNYNQVQKAAGVNRERQLYDIPLENDEAPIVIKKYFKFSYSPLYFLEYSFDSIMALAAANTLIGKNKINEVPTQIQYMLLQTVAKTPTQNEYYYPQSTENSDGNTPYLDNNNARFVLPVASYAHGKVMTFSAMPLDNYSISYARDGYKFSIWGDGGYRMTYNQYVSKAQPIVGESHGFKIDYAYNFNGGEKIVNKFPIVENPSENFSLATKQPIYIEYNKDRTQKPVFALSLECRVSEIDKNDLIIGSRFATMNNLIRNNEDGADELKVYASNNYVFAGDEENLPSNYINHTVNVTSLFSIRDSYFGIQLVATTILQDTNIKSWAIADGFGRIYLAGNGKPKTIYCGIVDKI